jgi:hypothetical protein
MDQNNFIYNPKTFVSSRSFFHTLISEMLLVQWHFLRDGAVSEKKQKHHWAEESLRIGDVVLPKLAYRGSK